MKSLRKWIIDKLNKNDNLSTEVYKYYNDAKELGLTTASLSSFKRIVRTINHEVLNDGIKPNESGVEDIKEEFIDNGDNTANLDIKTHRITTLDQLIRKSQVDLTEWNIDRHVINKWEVGAKNDNGKIEVSPLFQVKVWLSKKVPDKQKFPTINPVRFPDVSITTNNGKPKNNKRSIYVSDFHFGFNRNIDRMNTLIPYHDRKTISAFLSFVKSEQPDEIIIGGDLLDLAEASSFSKKPEFYFTVQPAINETGWFLHTLRKNCPNTKIVVLMGNHTKRIERNIIDNMLFSYNLKPFGEEKTIYSLRNLLGTDKMGITTIEDYPEGEYWINDNTKCVHGEYTTVNKLLATNSCNVICGHLHRQTFICKNHFYKNSMKSIEVHVSGCMCQIKNNVVPQKSSKPNWQQGFIEIYSSKSECNIHHIKISDNKIMYRDNVYEGQDYSNDIKDIL